MPNTQEIDPKLLREQIRGEVLEEIKRDPSNTLFGIPMGRLQYFLNELATYSGDAHKYIQETDLRAERMAKAWCQYVPGMRYPANPVFGETATGLACPRCEYVGLVRGPELDKKRLCRCPNCGDEVTLDAFFAARRVL